MSKTLTGNPDLVDPGFKSPSNNPMDLLKIWLECADRLNISEPRSLVLSTVNKTTLRPSSRVVLLKSCDDSGVIFSTSSFSAKGQEIEKNPIAAGNLWWRETMQQINFQGLITKCSDAMSDEIFYERTRSAQAITVLSQQSQKLLDEAALRNQINALTNSDSKIIRPEHFCAYHLEIDTIEFWHGSKDRFHQRLLYQLKNHTWSHERLQP